MQDTRPARHCPTWWLLAALSVAGCATIEPQAQSLVPTRYQTRTGPYAVFTNFPIAADAPAIRSLQALERDIEASLGIRIAAEERPVEVYILDDRQSFVHFLKFYYPELPPRRAFFLAQGPQRVVFTFMGDRLEEDLRHEATHALLHLALGDLPLWLDEGLAEYFEVPEGRHGVNAEHLVRLPQDLASGWRPDLVKLEALKNVRQMAPRDYRESWAWVHYFLNDSKSGKAMLLAYLADLRASPKAPPLSERLHAAGEEAGAPLIAHLDRVCAQPIATSSPPSGATTRLQDAPIVEAPRPPMARRGLLGRLRALFED